MSCRNWQMISLNKFKTFFYRFYINPLYNTSTQHSCAKSHFLKYIIWLCTLLRKINHKIWLTITKWPFGADLKSVDEKKDFSFLDFFYPDILKFYIYLFIYIYITFFNIFSRFGIQLGQLYNEWKLEIVNESDCQKLERV